MLSGCFFWIRCHPPGLLDLWWAREWDVSTVPSWSMVMINFYCNYITCSQTGFWKLDGSRAGMWNIEKLSTSSSRKIGGSWRGLRRKAALAYETSCRSVICRLRSVLVFTCYIQSCRIRLQNVFGWFIGSFLICLRCFS